MGSSSSADVIRRPLRSSFRIEMTREMRGGYVGFRGNGVPSSVVMTRYGSHTWQHDAWGADDLGLGLDRPGSSRELETGGQLVVPRTSESGNGFAGSRGRRHTLPCVARREGGQKLNRLQSTD